MTGKYDVQPQLPLPAEADPNQPELPFINKAEVLQKGDFLYETLMAIETNLANTTGLSAEGREELENSRQYFEEQLGLILELGASLGFFEREGAPIDNYETVAA